MSEDIVEYKIIDPDADTGGFAERQCGDCTACCDGNLHGEIYGRRMFPGQPCHFVSQCKGCMIYEQRPQFPCKDFRCEWLLDDGTVYPEWMQPNKSRALISTKSWDGGRFYQVVQAGDKMTPEILMWVLNELLFKRNSNMSITIGRMTQVYGSTEFTKWWSENRES